MLRLRARLACLTEHTPPALPMPYRCWFPFAFIPSVVPLAYLRVNAFTATPTRKTYRLPVHYPWRPLPTPGARSSVLPILREHTTATAFAALRAVVYLPGFNRSLTPTIASLADA